MLQTQNKIILVDNNPEHLIDLSNGFFDDNISCLPLVYDVAYESPINGIRLAFFDINLLDSSNEAQILSTIVSAIPKYIDKDNGPFALIFWTDKKEFVLKIKNYIKERDVDIPKPFLIDCIDKDECYNQPEKLKARLNDIFTNPTLNVVIEYENTVIDSVNKTTNQFFETIPTNDAWGQNEEYINNFDKIFSKIASSTLGIKHAKENPDKAIHKALTVNLNHHIEHSTRSNAWKSVLKTLDKAKSEAAIELVEGFNYSSLNNLLHINFNISELAKDDRGVVLELDKNILTEQSTDFNSFYESILPTKSDVLPSKEKKAIRNNSKLICIEISAGCDHSQKKKRINKYIFGILTPAILKEQIDLDNISAASMNVIDFEGSDGNNMQLWLHLNYMVGLNPNSEKLGDILFCLKSELVNYIGNRYANHISRIGITSF